MRKLDMLVKELETQVGEEQAEILIAGLLASVAEAPEADGERRTWFQTPALPEAFKDALKTLASRPWDQRIEAVFEPPVSYGGRPDRVQVYVQLYELSTNREAVLAMAKNALSPASYQRLRERLGLARKRPKPSE